MDMNSGNYFKFLMPNYKQTSVTHSLVWKTTQQCIINFQLGSADYGKVENSGKARRNELQSHFKCTTGI